MDSLPLSIPVKILSEHIHCPICMSIFKDTAITKCGHRYCDICIKEWINRKHKCPCCNSTLIEYELIKDHQYDELVGRIKEESNKAEGVYFSQFVEQHMTDSAQENTHQLSPVEEVLKKHMKSSLVAHGKYYESLKTEWMTKKDKLIAETENLVKDLRTQTLPQEEFTRQSDELLSKRDARLQEMNLEMENVTSIVAEAYDRYLTDHIPDLTVIPCKVILNLLCKDIKITDVILKPTNSISHLRDRLVDYMDSQGDSIIEMAEDVKFISFGPFSKSTNQEMTFKCMNLTNEKTDSDSDINILHPDAMILLQYNLRPGSEICVYGVVKCKSDLPRSCFSSTFEAGKTQKVDYFSCKQCSINWVCRPCFEVCHKDHECEPYIMKHQPTWACCYCPKKKGCQINGVPTVTASPFHKVWTKT